MDDRPSDPEALERYIERNVQELARTVDEIADRTNPKNVARRGADRLKEEAGQVAKAVGAMIGAPADADDPERGGIDKRVVLAGAAAVTVAALVLWSRRRRRR
ncbi:DUF3618 domain-containing protein [Actinomadura livida]|uniref:HAMP domain-containing protein n=1 Tax=Actinomadura livida TaxID=79909 RepID=A0A7W7N074_9ACTN|nr:MULTISPECIES: DUF3618 domain-containing protein [Actinomadura]MBB4777578.1 HAMP domain-containing protein [Actinomadura catellatispora]GGU00163.1 hypothetical protein GCM10010208_24980 [Actinomadura livida]